MNMTALICPQCNGRLAYDIEKPYAICSHCGTTIVYEDISSNELVNKQRAIRHYKQMLDSAIASSSFEQQIFCVNILNKLEPNNMLYCFYKRFWRVVLGQDMLTNDLLDNFNEKQLKNLSKLVRSIKRQGYIYNRPVCILALEKRLKYLINKKASADEYKETEGAVTEETEVEEAPIEYSESDDDIVLHCMELHNKKASNKVALIVSTFLTILLFIFFWMLFHSLKSALFATLISGIVVFLIACLAKSEDTSAALAEYDVQVSNGTKGKLYLYQDGVVVENLAGELHRAEALFPLETITAVKLVEGKTIAFIMEDASKNTVFKVIGDTTVSCKDLTNYIQARLNARRGFYGTRGG